MFQNVLVPLDGSDYALRALTYAEGLAKVDGAKLTLLSVLMRPEQPDATHVGKLDEQSKARLESELQEIATQVKGRGLEQVAVEVRFGEPAHQITDFATAAGVDLIAMSTHGTGASGRYALGSIALKVLMSAPCPVFMVRIPEHGAA